jgi:hypothetical protein
VYPITHAARCDQTEDRNTKHQQLAGSKRQVVIGVERGIGMTAATANSMHIMSNTISPI